MSRLGSGSFALTSDGHVLLNAAELDGVEGLESAVRVARLHGAVVFVGVQLRRTEVRAALNHVQDVFAEAAAYAAGRRQRARRSGR